MINPAASVIIILCSATIFAETSGHNLTAEHNKHENLWAEAVEEGDNDDNDEIANDETEGGPESKIEVQASFLQLATKILEMNDLPTREGATMFMAQDQLVRKRQNKGKAAGMGGFTRSPIMHDVGCEGALPIRCSAAARFRTISGICNNLDHPLWGSASSRLARFVPPAYGDGRKEPRGVLPESCEPLGDVHCARCFTDPKAPLPSARQISLAFHREFSQPDRRLTHMMAQFGQFLDHDIALSPEEETEEDCCFATAVDLEECFPILLPRNDPVYHPANCLDFKRSIGFCNASHATLEQVNALTSFVDASMVYGSSPEDGLELREEKDGKLKTSINNGDGKEFLPILGNERDENGTAGDVRANEQPGLFSMHVVFLREHNRLAAIISDYVDTINKKDKDDQIYQYARHILAAQWQNIVYKDWLPIVLGEKTMAQFRLNPDYRRDRYCDKTDPSLRNSFSTAAFRFGHSMIQGMFELFSPRNRRQKTGSFLLRDSFFTKEHFYNVEQIVTGLFQQNAQTFDEAVTEDLGDFLFRNLNELGSDLLARNIQRGRDHGLPGHVCPLVLFLLLL